MGDIKQIRLVNRRREVKRHVNELIYIEYTTGSHTETTKYAAS